ncbi:pyridoxamine 5'-phosphate oxidase [Dysgonomonas sp. OttesenSCG-928-M03]|nr:pyridoxamine 5'-phosphate oxidase [Dysgonomonas sp. OttesenSCG-928-M03]
MIDIFDLRREFTLKTLDEKDVKENPLDQFEKWFKDAIEAKVPEPNAMALATVGFDLKPSCRIVLLKQVKTDGFIFFSNYKSRKGQQISENPYCALTFAWYELERQIRIEGNIEKLSPTDSDTYFESRPTASKLGAWASPQSQPIQDRAYLEALIENYETEFAHKEIKRPNDWGGYLVRPHKIEFWQGRQNRLHDRIQYDLVNKRWIIKRIAP